MDYKYLGARPKISQESNLLRNTSANTLADRKKTFPPYIATSGIGSETSPGGYVKKLSSWFDGRMKIKDAPVGPMSNENVLDDVEKCDKSVANLPDVSLESKVQNHHERHLQVKQLNLMSTEAETGSSKVNSNFGRNISLKNDPKSQNMAVLKCLEIKGSKLGLNAATPEKGGGAKI